jgi:membrane protein implicated in regulation of membrane protease activity
MNDVRKSNSARKGVHCVKKLLLVSFALALVVSLLALAQETTKSGAMKQETTKAEKMSAKAVAVSGTVSADGKTFVDKDNKSWTVTNPEALKGHEGHEVTLTAHVDAAKNEVHVVSVKMGKTQMKDATTKDEMKK